MSSTRTPNSTKIIYEMLTPNGEEGSPPSYGASAISSIAPGEPIQFIKLPAAVVIMNAHDAEPSATSSHSNSSSYKALCLGNSESGKSEFIKVACQDPTIEYRSTIGVDFQLYSTEINNESVRCQLWDTAGQERYRTLASTSSRGMQFIFIFDDAATTRAQLEHLLATQSGHATGFIINYQNKTISETQDLHACLSSNLSTTKEDVKSQFDWVLSACIAKKLELQQVNQQQQEVTPGEIQQKKCSLM